MGTIASNRRRAANILVTSGLLLTGGILVFSVEQIITTFLSKDANTWVYILLFFFLFPAFAFITDFTLRRAGHVLGSNVKMSLPENEKPRKYLLTGYSPRNHVDAEAAVEIAKKLPFETIALPCDEYKEGEHGILGAWQQNARTLFHHRKTIQRIYIIRPDKNDAQFKQFKTFLLECLKSVKRDNVKIIEIHHYRDESRQFTMVGRTGEEEAPSYEDYDYVYEGLRFGLEMIKKTVDENVVERDICVDITPGLKPYSIAAAILTLNRKLQFSYVTMSGHLKFYDADISFTN